MTLRISWTLVFALLIACPAALGQVRSEAFPGVDACAQINAAMQSLPASGGVIDARAYSGTQICGSNPFIVPNFSGTLGAVSSGDITVSGGSPAPAWTAAQNGGALYCTGGTGGPVFLGVVAGVNTVTGTSLNLTAGAAAPCNHTPNNYIITAKSGVLLLGNAVYQAELGYATLGPKQSRSLVSESCPGCPYSSVRSPLSTLP